MTVSVVSWVLAAIAALMLACGADVFLAAPAMGADAWIGLACLVIAMGGLYGLVSGSAIKLLAKLGLRARSIVTSLVIAAASLHVAARLGVFVRLDGNYASLALAALGAAVIASLAATALVLAFVPSAQHPRGPMFRYRRWAWLPLLLLAVALFYADRRYWVGLYPPFHLSMRVASLSCGTFGILLLLPVIDASRRALAFTLVPPLGLAAAIVLGALRPAALFPLELAPWPLLTLSTARVLTDVDFDGYSGVLGGGDCAPFASRINPGAREIPGNGIDDNCLSGDAALNDVDASAVQASTAPPTRDVVLITIDSMRPDRMGMYAPAFAAHGLATTPNLDEFAKHGTFIFERAYTAGGWTSIALPSLLRGVYPRRLEWTRHFETNRFRLLRRRDLRDMTDDEAVIKMFPVTLTGNHPTIAARLRQRGMRTLAVVDDGFSDQLGRASGLAEGFDEYRKVDELAPEARSDQGTTDMAIRMLERIPTGTRFFLWVHYFGPHSPTEGHEGVRIDGSSLEQTYDHELRFVDQQVARLIKVLEGRSPEPAIVITADHGEDFIADGRHHGFSLSEAVIRVPLLVRIPGAHGRRVASPVSLVDVAPTLLTITDTALPKAFDGRSLHSTVDLATRSKRYLLADTWQYNHEGQLIRGQSAAFDGRRKVLFDRLLASWTIEDQTANPSPKRVSPRSEDHLVQSLVNYLESTGGDLRLAD